MGLQLSRGRRSAEGVNQGAKEKSWHWIPSPKPRAQDEAWPRLGRTRGGGRRRCQRYWSEGGGESWVHGQKIGVQVKPDGKQLSLATRGWR